MAPNAVEIVPPADALAGLADALKRAWRAGSPPDAAAAFRKYPELLRHRSLAIDLAYEDYSLREEAGRTPDPDTFCHTLPAFRSEVREVIRMHRLMFDQPAVLVPAGAVWPEPGVQFEGLTVIRELGRGAFARAYLALDPETGDRPVVLKLAPAPSTEGRTLGPIRHPHVVGVLWARRTQGFSAVCMPFVGAATLQDVIASFGPADGRRARSTRAILATVSAASAGAPGTPDPAPVLVGRESYPDAIAAIAARLADALAHLHRSGITHGDLKPSNVLLGPGGHPYLIDFNLATGRDANVLRCGGTLPYMAPEQLRLLLGHPIATAPTDRADVYALGVVLFEALTGRLPFQPADLPEPATVAADLLRRQSAGPPRVWEVNPTVPRSLAWVVGRCLEADDRRRPTADQLKAALDRYLCHRARRFRVLLGGAGLLSAGLLAMLLSGGPPPPAPATPPPPVGAVRPPPSTAEAFFARGIEFLRAGDLAPAMADFDAARVMRPDDGRCKAFLAYCLVRRQKDHATAAKLYEEAVADGYRAAWVHSNRAHSLIQLRSPPPPALLRLAIQEANAALELSPNLRPALYNRAVARYLLDLDPKTLTLSHPGCLNDLEAVLANGSCSADLYYQAALILAASGSERDDLLARAVGYLREAAARGKPVRDLSKNPVVRKHLLGRADFDELLHNPLPTHPAPPAALELADPPLP